MGKIIFNKKMKEHLTFTQMVALTNLKMLVNKGICTNEEWQEESGKIIEAIQSVAEKDGDYTEIAKKLNEIQ